MLTFKNKLVIVTHYFPPKIPELAAVLLTTLSKLLPGKVIITLLFYAQIGQITWILVYDELLFYLNQSTLPSLSPALTK